MSLLCIRNVSLSSFISLTQCITVAKLSKIDLDCILLSFNMHNYGCVLEILVLVLYIYEMLNVADFIYNSRQTTCGASQLHTILKILQQKINVYTAQPVVHMANGSVQFN